MNTTSDALRELAEEVGVSTSWTHADGRAMRVEDGPLRRILAAMDLPCETEAQCRQSRAKIAEESQRMSLPPLLTGWCGQSIVIDARAGLHGHRYEITVDGRASAGVFPVDRGLPLSLPPLFAPGYHTLEVDGRRITLAVAPTRCFSLGDISVGRQGMGKPWGLAVQLYSLRRQGDAGIGDFTALRQLAESAGSRGGAALAISPVHAMPGVGIRSFSPYSPSSRLFLNTLHIDPAAIGGQACLDEILAEDASAVAMRRKLEEAVLIDWSAASRWRIDIMRKLFERCKREGYDLAAFRTFRREGGEALEDHARFEALQAHFAAQGLGTYWPEWPEEYRHPRRFEVEAFAQRHADEVEFHAFLQWHAAQGMAAAQRAACDAGMPVGLINDLAIGSDRGGSHAWSRQGAMLNGFAVGAAPDKFIPQGQNWGLVTLCPRALRFNGFQTYIELLRATMRHAGGVRIDHILGLQRLWMIPQGATPECGAYLRYPLDDMLRLLALESHRNRAIVIGENLGTIPEGFNEKIVGAGVLGMQVLWFMRKGDDFLPPFDWASDGIGMTTTHDLPTVAGWWEGCDIRWKSRLDLFGKGATRETETHQRAVERHALRRALDAHRADNAADARGEETEEIPLADAISFVGATPAPLVIVPLEDALADVEQPNLPGTVNEHPNWRRRAPLAVDRMLDTPDVGRRIDALADSRRRAPQ